MPHVDPRIQARHFKVVVLEGHKVGAPLALVNFEHAVGLDLKAVVSDAPEVTSEQLIQLEFLPLGSKRCILHIYRVLTNLVEGCHIPGRELCDIALRHAKREQSFLAMVQVPVLIHTEGSVHQRHALVWRAQGRQRLAVAVEPHQADSATRIHSCKRIGQNVHTFLVFLRDFFN